MSEACERIIDPECGDGAREVAGMSEACERIIDPECGDGAREVAA